MAIRYPCNCCAPKPEGFVNRRAGVTAAPNPFFRGGVYAGMKRQRLLLPGAFSQLNLSEMHFEEERQNKLLSGLICRVLGLGAGLVLAVGLLVGLYFFKGKDRPPEQPVAQVR